MNVLGGSGYSIARSTGRCAATERALAVGERYVAVIVDREGNDALERVDFSLDAWNSGHRPAPPRRLFATWRAVMGEPNAKRHEWLGDDELLDLFEQLGESSEPRQRAFRYVLALLLVRRKKLIYEGARPGVIRVRPKKPTPEAPDPEPIDVTDPALTPDTLDAVMRQLSEIMASDAQTAPAPEVAR